MIFLLESTDPFQKRMQRYDYFPLKQKGIRKYLAISEPTPKGYIPPKK